ncbi:MULTISPECIES: flagellar basal-body MS-ring/collar protein FliF [Cytobacillus]|uniref:Flagellar M-ring protein n=1 Tax=Cytobacillus stercorigallinarum TaxID=2762240 RepID=A0ABR8QN23_9BACI|nr:flagellar basal-body MS-ring/collar protein FliF [Cytobacillus stercorigallinarum]MBD7936727.1 flagellar M-ring protein FliF [Cytobacillus stercorigallinarum]
MKDSLQAYGTKVKTFWDAKTKGQKALIIGAPLLLIIGISMIVFLSSRTTLVPLYSNLTPSETGSIKENLDAKGIKSEIVEGGTAIKVPEEQVDSLMVELAAEGIPDSGNIDYSFFSQNAGIGMTENEFDVMKLDAMQSELAELMKGIDGINNAKVMINMPESGVFLNETEEQASASIVLNTDPGYKFENQQIQALYHLVSKSVPNLPTDNIVITNQNFEYYDLKNSEDFSTGSQFAVQHEIKKEIEKDIQRQVQTMLATLMGQEKVVVSVTADVDFTQENREENLVEPVDEENMAGIAISAQKLTETFTGNGDTEGGIPQSEDGADALGSSYVEGSNSNGDYEKIEETINNEVNRIRKEIVESPYKVRDLGIQVMVEPPDANNPNSLPQDRINDITQILSTIIRTSIDKDTLNETLTDEELQNKIAVSVQEFNGKVEFPNEETATIPWWIYLVVGLLLLVIILLLWLFLRNKKEKEEEIVEYEVEEQLNDSLPDVHQVKETEASIRIKQLEKLAKEKPEDFAKLLRTWITED